MRGQRTSVESLPETLEFDHRSNPDTAGTNQDFHWSSVLLHPAESQNLPNCLLSSSDTSMSTEDSSSLRLWNSGGPSSTGNSVAQGNHDETKMELGWPASPVGEASVDADYMLSLDDVGINLNSSQIEDDESFSFSISSSLNDVSQDLDHNASHRGDEISEFSLFSHPYVPSLLDRDHGPSSSHSLGTIGFTSGDYDNRAESSLDGRRLAYKRKNIEGFHGQSSASGSTNFFHTGESNTGHSVSSRTNFNAGINISSPSSFMPGASYSGEQLRPRLNTITAGAVVNSYPTPPAAGNVESSQRNFRLRANPAHRHDAYPLNLSFSRDNPRNSNIWFPSETSSNLVPSNQRLEFRSLAVTSQNQPHMPVIPGLPRHVNLHPLNGVSASGSGSSLSSISPAEEFTVTREDMVSRNTPINDIPVQRLVVPTTEIRNAVQGSANWNGDNGSPSVIGTLGPTSSASTSSAVHSSLGPTWIPHHNPPSHFSRGLAEAVRRSLLASVGSESGGQSSNFLSQQSRHSSGSQETGHPSGSISHGNQRQTVLLDRQSDGISMSTRNLAAREGRSRMISEVCYLKTVVSTKSVHCILLSFN